MADDKPTTLSGARRVALQASVGALVGLLGAGLGGPAVISWWYEPPSRDAFSCAGSVKTALSQFLILELMSAAVGAVVLALVMFLIRRSLAKRRAARGPATAS